MSTIIQHVVNKDVRAEASIADYGGGINYWKTRNISGDWVNPLFTGEKILVGGALKERCSHFALPSFASPPPGLEKLGKHGNLRKTHVLFKRRNPHSAEVGEDARRPRSAVPGGKRSGVCLSFRPRTRPPEFGARGLLGETDKLLTSRFNAPCSK